MGCWGDGDRGSGWEEVDEGVVLMLRQLYVRLTYAALAAGSKGFISPPLCHMGSVPKCICIFFLRELSDNRTLLVSVVIQSSVVISSSLMTISLLRIQTQIAAGETAGGDYAFIARYARER